MKKRMNLEEIILEQQQSTKKSIPPKQLGSLHEFYISGPIEGPEEYIEMFDRIRHAGELDVVKIYINSPGGSVSTAIQFMRVVAESSAEVITSAEGECASAATIMFLCGDSYEVTPHTTFMFHNYSGAAVGKGGEMIDQMIYERKWSEKLLRESYKDFLTEDEITSMLNNKDIWMDAEEVIQRLTDRAAKRQQQQVDVKTEEDQKVE